MMKDIVIEEDKRDPLVEALTDQAKTLVEENDRFREEIMAIVPENARLKREVMFLREEVAFMLGKLEIKGWEA